MNSQIDIRVEQMFTNFQQLLLRLVNNNAKRMTFVSSLCLLQQIHIVISDTIRQELLALQIVSLVEKYNLFFQR